MPFPCFRVFLAFLFCVNAFGQSQISDDQEFLRKHQFDLVSVTGERADDYAVTKVFRNPIYHLTVAIKEGYGQSPYWGNLVAARVGDQLVPVPRPLREGDVPDLVSMLRSDFKLTTEDAAETLQRAFDLIYPPATSDAAWAEKFRRDGNQWTFVRTRSMGSIGPSTLVVTTDQQGLITQIRYVRGPLPTAAAR